MPADGVYNLYTYRSDTIDWGLRNLTYISTNYMFNVYGTCGEDWHIGVQQKTGRVRAGPISKWPSTRLKVVCRTLTIAGQILPSALPTIVPVCCHNSVAEANDTFQL